MRISKYLPSPRLFKPDEGEGGEGGSSVVGTGNDARLAILSGIADSSDGERADQLEGVNDDGTTEPFEEPVKAEESETKEVVEETPLTEEVVPKEEEPKKFKLKVNGKEIELTEAELIERAQKVEAADDYLRIAAEKRKAAEALNQPPQPTAEELRAKQDLEDRALARSLQVGTEEEAAEVIRKIRASASASRPSMSMDDVSRTIDERLAFNTAVTWFQTEYKDIHNDPYLRKLALDRDDELMESGDTRSYKERYREIGDGIRTWKAKLLSDVQPPADDKFKSKEEKKALVPGVPPSGSQKLKQVVQEEEPDESPSEIIQSMQKSRGGPQWMR